MLVSILHRATGVALATAGVVIFAWWLAALAGGSESYGNFTSWVIAARPDAAGSGFTNLFSRLVGIGLTWAFFQHLANGVRHLFLDMGANFELRSNKRGAVATMIVAMAATVLVWGYILGVKG